MTLLAPAPVTTGAPLARRNPCAKITAAAVILFGLVLSTDLVAPVVVLVAELLLLPFCGIGARGLWRRGWPMLVGAAGLLFTNLLLGHDPDGRRLLDVGPLEVTSGTLVSAIAISVRILAIALPGVLVAATTDPVDLADSLVQQWHVSPRFAYGALAALRLLPLLADEWRTLGMARRARGVEAGRNPVAALRLFAGKVFALLVSAIRRGIRLAAAMDARGFDAGVPRTIARVQRVERADVALVVASAGVLLAAVALSVAAGDWHPLWG